jgi:hypothetical protein
MERRGDQIVETESEASAGSKEGVVRWVLLFALGLAIVATSIIWITGALSQGQVEEEGDVSGKIAAQQENSSVDSTNLPRTQETPLDTTVAPAAGTNSAASGDSSPASER